MNGKTETWQIQLTRILTEARSEVEADEKAQNRKGVEPTHPTHHRGLNKGSANRD